MVHLYLLSHEMGRVGGFHFESTVVGPQVNRVGNAGDTTLVELRIEEAHVSNATANPKQQQVWHLQFRQTLGPRC